MILRSLSACELSKALYKQCQISGLNLLRILGKKRINSSWHVMIPEELDLSRNLWIALARWKEREQELNY